PAVDGRSAAVIIDTKVAENEFAITAFVDAANAANCTEAHECIIAVRIDVNGIGKDVRVDADVEGAGCVVEGHGIAVEKDIRSRPIEPIGCRAIVPGTAIVALPDEAAGKAGNLQVNLIRNRVVDRQ